jgi:hypothetical protein
MLKESVMKKKKIIPVEKYIRLDSQEKTEESAGDLELAAGSADAFDETENPRNEIDKELSDEQLDEELEGE